MKIKGLFRAKPIIFTIALSLLFSPSYFFSSKAFALSIDNEKKMGREFLSQIRRQFELLDDDFANQFFNDLGHYLIIPLETKHFPFNFYIVQDNTLNAFAGPGGQIFFFSGLIEGMDTVDDLAAVMCHEIGHVSARHLSDRIEQSKKIGLVTLAGILAGMLIGGEVAGALITGSMAAGIQAQLHYSREDERQADQLGFKYMKTTGFDPKGMISTLKKLNKGNWLGTDKIPPYLLTHPTGPERMSNLDMMLSYYSPAPRKKEAERFRALFPFFQTVVRARCMDPHDAEKLFTLELEKKPGTPLPHFGLGIVHLAGPEYDQAIRHLKKAREAEPGFIPILTKLGEAYQMSGQDREAISVLEEALKLDDANKSASFLLGLSYENLGKYEKAARFFERLKSFEPVKNEVYYHLGISYGRQDRLMLAHYNFGLYFNRLGRTEKARFHFQKALELSDDNPALREKIKKEIKGLRSRPSRPH